MNIISNVWCCFFRIRIQTQKRFLFDTKMEMYLGKDVLLHIIFLLCMRKQVGLRENKYSLSVLLEQMGVDDDF